MLVARGAACAPGRDVGGAGGPEPDLDVRGLRKRFGDARRLVLDGVSLLAKPGEAVALVGPNGAGKSTLLRCCLRLVEPDEGEVRLLGHDLRATRGRALRRARAATGFVFQRHNLVARLSVLSNVVHGALSSGWGAFRWHHALAPRAVRERAFECLGRVGLVHLAGQRADRLSGGESQRVAIARALMGSPRLVFADEPVASLDPAIGEEVMRLFAHLIRRSGMTLVFTSHQLDHALAYSDRVVALRAGRVVLDAPSRDVSRAELRGIYA
ncbi:MAG: phosphonate ABC transporter ATP-binding protein [Planctomycetota bacterium]